MLPGPARADAGLAALNEFVNKENARRQAAGEPPLSNQERFALRKSWVEANSVNDNLVFQNDDPNVASTYLGQLSTLQGSAFNAATERRNVLALAATIRDPAKKAQFQATALNEIQQKEKEVQDFSAYSGIRDKVIKDNIESRIQRNYDASGAYTKPDRVESERRQRMAYTALVNDRIKEREAQLQRKLSESEVRSLTQTAIDEYGSKNKDSLPYLFPGSMAYPKSPSVDPAATMKSVPLGPDGQPKPNGGKPVPPVYEINQLDDIPNRRQELVQYQSKPVLSLNAVRQSFFDVMNGKRLSPAIERAWRDAQAPNPYVFLERQLKMYPNYKGGEWTPAEMKKAKQKLTSDAALEGQAVSKAAMSQSMPMLASLGNWAGNTLLGIGPASAATYDTLAIRGGGGNSAPFTGSPTAPGGDVGQFRRAIIGKESGGNYGAVNPDSGALGIGQVMPANVASWTKKYLGRALTPQQFLADRNAQDTVVNGRFNDMLADQRKAGFSGEQMIRRAAAVWYSNRPDLWNDTKPQYTKGRRYPSIGEYTQAIWDSYRRGG